MIITCEECSTRFDLDESILKSEGSKVRCSLCKHIFTAFPQISDTIVASEPKDEIEFDFPEDIVPEGFEPDNFEADNLEPDNLEPDNFDADDFEPDESETNFEETDFEISDLDFELKEEDLDTNGTDLTMETGSDSADIEINFDPESDELDFDEDELTFDEDELTFDDADMEFDNPDPKIEDSNGFDSSEYTIDPDSFTLELDEETIEDALEADLSFEDDPDADLVFEETGPEQDLAQALETEHSDDQNMTFPGLRMETKGEPPNNDPDLEFELDEARFEAESTSSQPDIEIAEETILEPGDEFSSYDQILDQDTEPEEDLHNIEMTSEPEPQSQLNEKKQESTLIEPPILAHPGHRKRKKRSAMGSPVMLLLLLFILVAGAYIASMSLGYKIPFLSDVKIPILEQYFKKATPEKSAPKPIPNEGSVNGRFISNDTAGELFIISGRIENPATIPYSHIKVKGTLITKGKVKARTQNVFCGNIISEEMLKTGNISDISKQLTTREGSHNSNVNVKPGGFVPFMLVFSSLPENLENFTVEVVEF